jgi:hypothetical protein
MMLNIGTRTKIIRHTRCLNIPIQNSIDHHTFARMNLHETHEPRWPGSVRRYPTVQPAPGCLAEKVRLRNLPMPITVE